MAAYKITPSGPDRMAAYKITSPGPDRMAAYKITSSGPDRMAAYKITPSGPDRMAAYKITPLRDTYDTKRTHIAAHRNAQSMDLYLQVHGTITVAAKV